MAEVGELIKAAGMTYEDRGNAAQFALDIKNRVAAELEEDSAVDEARKARIALALRFVNDSVLDPVICGELDPRLCAFLDLAVELTEFRPEADVESQLES